MVMNIIVKILEKLVAQDSWLERLVAKYSLIGDSVFFDSSVFPWVEKLEKNWLVIRKEFDNVLNSVDDLPNYQDISERQYAISHDKLWKTYFFFAFGYKAVKNCEFCPETTKLLQEISGLKVAFFSILAPGKHIPEHRGKHKGLIRYHLALKVPQDKFSCQIRINNQVAYWEEGKSLIFDDTFLHEAWNKSDEYRAVLFLDIARPLAFPMSLVNWLVNRLIMSSDVVKSAKLNHERWEQKFYQD